MDPRTSRWMSPDPILGKYLPEVPIDDEAKKRNQNLPGGGGVFNPVNLALYHYAGNNPIKYVDPNGEAPEYRLRIQVDKIVQYGHSAEGRYYYETKSITEYRGSNWKLLEMLMKTKVIANLDKILSTTEPADSPTGEKEIDFQLDKNTFIRIRMIGVGETGKETEIGNLSLSIVTIDPKTQEETVTGRLDLKVDPSGKIIGGTRIQYDDKGEEVKRENLSSADLERLE